MSKRKNTFGDIEPSKISKAEINHIKELVDQVENEEFEELNPSTLKKLVFSFEKKLIKNEQLRLKFKNDPEKFMDSEIELDEEIKKFQILATSPDLYKLFVSLKSVESLGSLILHENTDISIDVIDLFNELMDQEDGEQDEGLTLLHSYIDNGVVGTLVDNLSRLDGINSNDEQQAIHNTFSIFESMLDLEPVLVSSLLGNKSNLFKYILSYSTNPKTPVPIKLYSSELLSTILLNDEASRSTFTNKYDGIEQLLVIISQFLKREVESLQEKEFIENLFSSICSLLLNNDTNKELFLKSEGIQLMLLFIKKKTQFRGSALKILDYSVTESKKSCQVFVKELGLKTLFSNFMKKIKSSHNKKIYNEKEDDEHIVTILYSLLRNLDKSSEYYERLMVKFTENSFEKVERLMELHNKYFRKVELSDRQLKMNNDKEDEDDQDDEDEMLLKRLDAGLFTLQYIDLILLLLSSENNDIKLKIQDTQIAEIKQIVNEYIETISKEEELNFIKNILKSF